MSGTRGTAGGTADPFAGPPPGLEPGTRAWLEFCLRADFAMIEVDQWLARYRLTRSTVHFQWVLRHAEYWCHPTRRGLGSRLMAAQLKVRMRRLSDRLGFEVPRYSFGPGLSIVHAGLLVVSASATVGARCRIHQGVTIGAAAGGAPRIGDDVFIGPNAVLIGPITVGDRAFIYPGAVCTIDVPAGHAAAGVPARVRPHDQPPWRPAPRPPA